MIALKSHFFTQNSHNRIKSQSLPDRNDLRGFVAKNRPDLPQRRQLRIAPVWKDTIVKNRTGIAFWIVALMSCTAVQAQEIRWAPDIATARRVATEFQVPLMLHFYGDNCLPCKVLEQNVFSKSEVVATLNQFFICVSINASQPQGRQTAAEYSVHSWPTDVFLGPDNKVLNQGTSKPNASEYLSVLQGVAVMNRDRNVLLASQQAQTGIQVTSQQQYTQPAATASQLPIPGTPQPANPQGPNFYAEGAGVGLQQLPMSLPPNPGVISGPMLVQNQPQAVRTSVQATGSQVAAAGDPYPMNEATGYLPPMTASSTIPPASQTPSAQQVLLSMEQMPSVAQSVQPSTQAATAWNRPAPYGRSSQTVDNPHFVTTHAATPAVQTYAATLPNSAAPSISTQNQPSAPTLSASQPSLNPDVVTRIPASTVSFQARTANPTLPVEQMTSAKNPISEQVTPTSAIEGYCPIALQKQGAWVKGQNQFSVKHRGRVYHMSTQQAMDEFLQSPDRSSPVMSGFDPMVFLKEGRLVEGSIRHGLHEQVSGSIMLFTSAQSKQDYEANFDRNTQALNVLLQEAGVK